MTYNERTMKTFAVFLFFSLWLWLGVMTYFAWMCARQIADSVVTYDGWLAILWASQAACFALSGSASGICYYLAATISEGNASIAQVVEA